MTTYTERDACERILRLRLGSLAPGKVTEEYLLKLRQLLYKFLERVEKRLLDLQADAYEPEDHSDDICPTCGDPDCSRPWGHEMDND